MTKEMEREIDELYEFLEIPTNDRKKERVFDSDGKRMNTFLKNVGTVPFFQMQRGTNVLRG